MTVSTAVLKLLEDVPEPPVEDAIAAPSDWPIDHVLKALDDLSPFIGETTERSHGYRARCPAHLGASANSLSILEAESGKVLLHCFQGCNTEKEVVPALGLIMGDLFPQDPGIKKWAADQRVLHAARLPAAGTAPNVWARLDVRPYLSGDFHEPNPIMLDRSDQVNLLYAHKLHWVSGEPEGLKTWLVLIAVADAIMDGHNALYIDFEDSPESVIGIRLRALGCSPEAIQNHLFYVRPQMPGTKQAVAGVLAEVAAFHPIITAIDGVMAAMGALDKDPNKSSDFYSWWDSLGGPTMEMTTGPMIAIDHVVKNPEARGKYASGTGQKLAKVDVHYSLEVTSPFGLGLTGRADLTTMKDRPGRLREHGGRWTPDKGQRIAQVILRSDKATGAIWFAISPPTEGAAAGSFRPTNLMERASRAVELAGSQGQALSKTAVVASVTGQKQGKMTAVDVLLAEGYFRRADKGGIISVREYRESMDPTTEANLSSPTFRQAGHRPGSSLVPASSWAVPGTTSSLVPRTIGELGEMAPLEPPASSRPNWSVQKQGSFRLGDDLEAALDATEAAS